MPSRDEGWTITKVDVKPQIYSHFEVRIFTIVHICDTGYLIAFCGMKLTTRINYEMSNSSSSISSNNSAYGIIIRYYEYNLLYRFE